MADIKVQGHPDLVRRGPGVISVDRQAYSQYVAQRKLVQQRDQQIKTLEERLARLESVVNAMGVIND